MIRTNNTYKDDRNEQNYQRHRANYSRDYLDAPNQIHCGYHDLSSWRRDAIRIKIMSILVLGVALVGLIMVVRVFV